MSPNKRWNIVRSVNNFKRDLVDSIAEQEDLVDSIAEQEDSPEDKKEKLYESFPDFETKGYGTDGSCWQDSDVLAYSEKTLKHIMKLIRKGIK